jgi:hypothetical protein
MIVGLFRCPEVGSAVVSGLVGGRNRATNANPVSSLKLNYLHAINAEEAQYVAQMLYWPSLNRKMSGRGSLTAPSHAHFGYL